MMARLRPNYNKLVLPFGKASLRLGLTPDFWTYFSLVSALVSCLLLAKGEFWFGFGAAVVMDVSDMMDGATARARGTASKFGTLLDHVVDRYAEFLLLAGLLAGNWISPWVIMFCISGMIMASYVRAKAESLGSASSGTVGITGRQEKLILILASIVLLAVGNQVIPTGLLLLTGLLSHITVLQRMAYSRASLAASGNIEKL